jgi:hypothetical protein
MPTVDEVIAARVRADIAEKMLEMLQVQLAEMTAQRDRWEQRFDQLVLSAMNAGERRPWWRRIRETTVDNRNDYVLNLMLDVLDKELEKRGHHFVRYADDCNIYVRSQRAGERVMTSIELFLTKHLKLTVNKAKSAVSAPQVRKFLGFSFTSGTCTKRRLAPQTVARFKARVQELTRRTRGRSLVQIVKELSVYLIGWRGYFGFCEIPTVLRALEQWTRRRLRAIAWKQWKRGRTRFGELIKRGVDVALAAPTAGSPHGPWRISNSPALGIAFPNAFFAALGLPSLVPSKPHNPPNRRIRTRTYGGVGGVVS